MSDLLFAWLGRMARRVGTPTLVTIALLVLALGVFWAGIADMICEAGNIPGLLVVLSGMTLAWTLARSRLPAAWALLVGGMAGIGFGLFAVGNLSIPLGAAVERLSTPISGQPGWSAWQASLKLLWDGLLQVFIDSSVLLGRLSAWLVSLFRSEAAIDPVARLIFWTLVVWGAGFWAGFVMRRRHEPLLALLPAGGVLAGLAAYTQGAVIYPLLLVGIYLALQVLLSYFYRVHIWAEEKVDAPELHLEVTMAAIGVPFLLAALAVLVPSISVRNLVEWIQRQPLPLQQESVARSLGIKPGTGEVSGFQSAATMGLAREHLIGSGPELSEQPVLRASLAGLQAGSMTGMLSSEDFQDFPPLYWRLLTYDHYNGYGWSTSNFYETDFEAGELRIDQGAFPEQGWVTRQTITKANRNNPALYTAGEFLSANEPFHIAARSAQDLFGVQTESRSYTADSILVSASAAGLQTAGTDYPDWVRANYLQLPENISTRVTRLALDLTAREPTPYDRAAAIAGYLRTFPYSLDLPKPPAGREISDYFLFELKRGYCDYYATSMVVLARAAGLPARLVIGYASGSWDVGKREFAVTEAEAHSWVEIYFPGYGWVEFEPTAGRPEFPRQAAPRLAEQEGAGELLPPFGDNQGLSQVRKSWLAFLLGSSTLLAAGLAFWVMSGWLRLRRMSPQALMRWQYRRLRVYGNRMGVVSSAGVTPLEFSALLSRELQSRENRKEGEPEAEGDLQALRWFTQVYSRASYSRTPATPAEKADALKNWRRLAPRLWWLGFRWRLRRRMGGN